MKILFLDIDGVVNCATTPHINNIGIDPHMAFKVGKIILETDAEIVLSSTWRLWEKSVNDIIKHVHPIYDKTPKIDEVIRGEEIKAWLDEHPDIETYAILDDNDDMLPEQLPNFFQTTWEEGITDDIMNKVIKHLNI